ncbi:hypothetical protein JCM11251_006209 [Rhodosporidiobolus azoricus]
MADFSTPTRPAYARPMSPYSDYDRSYSLPGSPWPEQEGLEPEERQVKFRRSGNSWWRSRTSMALAVLGATALLWVTALDRHTNARGRLRSLIHDLTGERIEGFNKSIVLNFDEPQPLLTSQIKPGVRYITTLSYGGHANQFIGIQNLLYLGKLLNRVVIIPTLTPLHFQEYPADFSRFYNLDRFYHETRIPAVQLGDLKYWNFTAPPPQEPLSCWSTLERIYGGRNVNDGSMAVHNIDVKYFPMPPDLALAADGYLWLEAIHQFDYNWYTRQEWLKKVQKELLPQKPPPEDPKATLVPLNRHQNLKDGFDPGRTAPPRDDLLCLDNTFFLASLMFPPAFPPPVPLEPLRSYEGHGWIDAGQYIHFSDEIEQLADVYLMDLFEAKSMKDLPPFITVHIRRGDFSSARGLTSMDKFTDAVQRVRDKLNWRMDHPDGWMGAGKGKEKFVRGVRAEQYAVVATTDEKPDSDFVQTLKRDYGWKFIDHDSMNTKEELGNWYPTMIDSAVLARGSGFVGTEWSTFSYLAGLRVKYWNGGVEDWTPSLA